MTNKLKEGTEFAECTLEEIIKKADGPLYNNAAQAWNHIGNASGRERGCAHARTGRWLISTSY